MALWARSAVRSVLATALRMPKKAAPPAKKEKAVRSDSPVLETSKPGDPITGLNYLKSGKGTNYHLIIIFYTHSALCLLMLGT